ncbi:hypothetical protein [Bacillus cereus]|uniref:hypothetical protein n=1 Tax=Bacillus cereus TaxID=1396 RepID=UPI0009525728|nr:hypothetical protein [Bacillus cereus]OLR25064.1 hypothetical protein BLD50_14145 [Bacillus cereus]
MKPIKHMRSKRGFYIGRVAQEVGKRINSSNLSSEFAGKPGKGTKWSLNQLIVLDGACQKGTKCIDPKASLEKHRHKL